MNWRTTMLLRLFGRSLISLILIVSVTSRAETEVLRASGRVAVSEDKGKSWAPLKGKKRFRDGVVFKTETNAFVDVQFDGGSLMRVTEESSVCVDRMTKVGNEIEIQIDLKSGRMFGIATNLAVTSKFEVKTPVGVAGIRGESAAFDVWAPGICRCVEGELFFVWVVDGVVVPPARLIAGERLDPPQNVHDFVHVTSMGHAELLQFREELDDLRRSARTNVRRRSDSGTKPLPAGRL